MPALCPDRRGRREHGTRLDTHEKATNCTHGHTAKNHQNLARAKKS